VVIPLLASGLLKGLLPVGASLLSKLPDVSGLLSGFGSLFGGPSESGERDPDFSGDDALVAQIALHDPSVRAAVLREIDRRLSDGVPEDAETTARLERLRDLLRRIDAEQVDATREAADEGGQVEREPSGEPAPPPRAPATAVAALPESAASRPAEPFPAGRILPLAAKEVPETLRAVSAAAPPGQAPSPSAPVAAEAAGPANTELVDRILRASRLVQARGISRLRLTLDPPELGEVRLDLTLRRNVVYGTFQAEAPGAAGALLSRLSELKDALEKRGLQVGELSVLAAGAEAGSPFLPPPPSVPGNLDLKA
jgi:hypothetical protein